LLKGGKLNESKQVDNWTHMHMHTHLHIYTCT